jgi:hypothetical protein
MIPRMGGGITAKPSQTNLAGAGPDTWLSLIVTCLEMPNSCPFLSKPVAQVGGAFFHSLLYIYILLVHITALSRYMPNFIIHQAKKTTSSVMAVRFFLCLLWTRVFYCFWVLRNFFWGKILLADIALSIYASLYPKSSTLTFIYESIAL